MLVYINNYKARYCSLSPGYRWADSFEVFDNHDLFLITLTYWRKIYINNDKIYINNDTKIHDGSWLVNTAISSPFGQQATVISFGFICTFSLGWMGNRSVTVVQIISLHSIIVLQCIRSFVVCWKTIVTWNWDSSNETGSLGNITSGSITLYCEVRLWFFLEVQTVVYNYITGNLVVKFEMLGDLEYLSEFYI